MGKRKGISYLSMTMKACRDIGRSIDKCEHFNPYGGMRINGKPTGIRVDLFNFIDAISLHPTEGIVAIQSCGPSGHSQHKKKILANKYAPMWLNAGGQIELWSWRKLIEKRGGKLRHWHARIERIHN